MMAARKATTRPIGFKLKRFCGNSAEAAVRTLKVSAGLLAGILATAIPARSQNTDTLERISGFEEAVLTSAPFVPPPIKRKYPTKIVVTLEVTEVEKMLLTGVKYTFWTFGGEVPGKFIRIREGDEVEFHLSNHPQNKMPHNIDLHAVTGPGGGAASSFTAPGHSSTFTFRALNPGLYVYHCATAPVGMHIANGMYGLILVEPKEGMPPVDKEFYVMQSEFYTTGKYGEEGMQPFSMEKAVEEKPDYVVFNGSVGALLNEGALMATVGETVRIFVGNGGPNLVSSFHIIGEIFDRVLTEGGTLANQKNVQTTLIPSGGSSIVEFKLDVPGNYLLVDHSIFRTFNKGSLGMLKVSGEENKAIYSGKQFDEVYHPEGGAIQSVEPVDDPDGKPATPAPKPVKMSLPEILNKGKRVYTQNCAACHQPLGQGVANAFPPLAKADYLMADKKRSILILKNGLQKAITVNGVEYYGLMPKLGLSDIDIACVLTYVRNSFGNTGEPVSVEEVQAVGKGK